MSTGTETNQQPQTEKEPSERNDEKLEREMAKKRATLKWWFITVVLTLFPTIATIIGALLKEDVSLTWDLVLGQGEIILASFLIVASTLMAGYTAKDETVFTDLIRYILFFLATIQLFSYAVIRTNKSNSIMTLIISSFSALFMSILVSWIWFTLTYKEE